MTTVTLRPIAPSANYPSSAGYGWTAATAAAIDVTLADSSDTTFMYTTNGSVSMGGALLTTFLDHFTFPAGIITKSVGIRYRASWPSGATTTSTFPYEVRAVVVLPYGAVTTFTHPALTATATNYTEPVTFVTLTQAQVNNLSIGIQNWSHNGSYSMSAVYEAWVDLVYATQPTATVTGPTGTITSTTSPLVSFVYTAGIDGDVQSRYQMRTFTAAQYGIGGFDPAVSPAIHDTGIILGTGSSSIVGPLGNGAHRTYVAVAQMINGIPHWSTWTAYTAFTISLTTSDLTSVAATADNANGRITLLVTRNGTTPTWQFLEVQRSADAGTTWSYIRGGNLFAVTGSTWTSYDYEAETGVSVIYRARASYGSAGTPAVGPWVSSSTVSWTADGDWLKDPRYTALNVRVNLRSHPTVMRNRTQNVLVVVNRADPVVVSDVRQLTSGTLTFQTDTDAAAYAFLALTAGSTLLLQTHGGNRFRQKWITIGAVTESAVIVEVANSPYRFWSITFVETAAPADMGIV